MPFQYTYPGGVVVSVEVSRDVNVTARLQAYEAFPGTLEDLREQILAKIYAQATYLKYQTANQEFGVVASSEEDLAKRLAAPHHQQETLALLEATRWDTHTVVGSALIRFAWTRDLVFDFVGTNPTAKKVPPSVSNIGGVLIHSALALAHRHGALMAFAETARHSGGWWKNYLPDGSDLLRAGDVGAAFQNVQLYLAKSIKIGET